MNTELRKDADYIIDKSIKAVLPDEAVKRALKDFKPSSGKVVLVAAGKAAWQMAAAGDSQGTYQCIYSDNRLGKRALQGSSKCSKKA